MKLNLGFSTGALYKTKLSLSQRIAFIKKFGCRVIELGYVKTNRFAEEPLAAINDDSLSGFTWVSFHAPGSDFKFNTAKEATKLLDEIQSLHERRPLDAVVFHPDSFQDFSILAPYSFPVCMENMDNEKLSFQRPAHLQEVFSKYPEWKLVLDLNHCYTNDKSMVLAKEFYQAFPSRIVHLHISGFAKLHEPLFFTQKTEILAAIQNWQMPIMIESSLASLEDAKKEYSFITNFYDQKNS